MNTLDELTPEATLASLQSTLRRKLAELVAHEGDKPEPVTTTEVAIHAHHQGH